MQHLIVNINQQIISPLIGLIFAAGFVLFLYGVFKFLAGADNESDRSTGKQHMVWGIIGMFIMISVFGIMSMIINTFGIDQGTLRTTGLTVPQIGTVR